ncbi:MAG TPA: hypothetical protein VKB02_00440 [Pyrinomonadaceae bacterium]|nr:hypothetical protein [Pyrinomonadaceae bacterium]
MANVPVPNGLHRRGLPQRKHSSNYSAHLTMEDAKHLRRKRRPSTNSAIITRKHQRNSLDEESIYLLTFEWFLPKAFFGLAVGFALRVIEHYAYHKRKSESVERLFTWSLVVLTQSICVVIPLAYIILAILISKFPSETFATGAAYMLPVMTGFIAVDLRELVRRDYRRD